MNKDMQHLNWFVPRYDFKMIDDVIQRLAQCIVGLSRENVDRLGASFLQDVTKNKNIFERSPRKKAKS